MLIRPYPRSIFNGLSLIVLFCGMACGESDNTQAPSGSPDESTTQSQATTLSPGPSQTATASLGGGSTSTPSNTQTPTASQSSGSPTHNATFVSTSTENTATQGQITASPSPGASTMSSMPTTATEFIATPTQGGSTETGGSPSMSEPSNTPSVANTTAPSDTTSTATASVQPTESASPSPFANTPTIANNAPVNLEGDLPFDELSTYNFFVGDIAELQPNNRVIAYDPISPLWTDDAEKSRFVIVPEGLPATFDAEGPWSWPIGTVLIKNFSLQLDKTDPNSLRRHLETRLLIHESEAEWSAHTYIWNVEQNEAIRTTGGKLIVVPRINEEGEAWSQNYLVPNTNQCGNCHEINDVFWPLGPTTEQLNNERIYDNTAQNQLSYLVSQGVLNTVPADLQNLRALSDPQISDDLNWQARSYLQANCAHCHVEGGGAHKSGLYLGAYGPSDYELGICKSPVAAGGGTGNLHYDIVPGNADGSILIYRMEIDDPGDKMPEVGTLYPDQSAIDMLRRWIDSMDSVDCDAL